MIVGLGNDMVGYIVPEYNQLHPNIPWFDGLRVITTKRQIPWVLKQPLLFVKMGKTMNGKKAVVLYLVNFFTG